METLYSCVLGWFSWHLLEHDVYMLIARSFLLVIIRQHIYDAIVWYYGLMFVSIEWTLNDDVFIYIHMYIIFS